MNWLSIDGSYGEGGQLSRYAMALAAVSEYHFAAGIDSVRAARWCSSPRPSTACWGRQRWLIEQFLPVRFKTEPWRGLSRIEVVHG